MTIVSNEIEIDTDGVRLWETDKASFVLVDSFTAQLEELLRLRLTEICWGPTANGSPLLAEGYSETMKSLWLRISKKDEKTKIGMAGELLTHLFLARPSGGYVSVNRMFNLEEAAIKKGFDLVLKSEKNDDIFLVEVKASAIPKVNSSSKLLSLLKVSNKDMFGKLSNPADNLWNNALSHCSSALKKTDLRDRIEDILEAYRDEALVLPTANSRNVILSGVSFDGENEFCEPLEVFQKIIDFDGWGDYKSLTFFVAQKKTFQAVLDFIESEAK